MEKVKVTFNELIAGALLKFGKVDSVDITLLMYCIENVATVVNNENDCMDEYFIMADGTIMLNDSYINKVYKNVNNSLLERMQGSVVKKFLDNLNIREFVLRKIKLLGNGCVPLDDIIHTFSVSQIYAIKRLYQEGLIMDYWHENCIYDDYQAIKLTKRGELHLFLLDNKKEIDKFAKLLRDNGYDETLIQAFLITQDLQKSPINILTLDNFIAFTNGFDLCPYAVSNKSSGHYCRSRIPSKKPFDTTV